MLHAFIIFNFNIGANICLRQYFSKKYLKSKYLFLYQGIFYLPINNQNI